MTPKRSSFYFTALGSLPYTLGVLLIGCCWGCLFCVGDGHASWEKSKSVDKKIF